MDKKIFYFGAKYKNVVMALSIASAWTWAPALITSTDMAANKGILGVASFIIPNILALFFFGWLMQHVNKDILTASGLVNNTILKNIYECSFIFVQICCIAINITAGANILKLTLGLNYYTTSLILLIVTFAYTLIGGLHYSIITDMWQQIILIIITIYLIIVALFATKTQIFKIGTFSIFDFMWYTLILFSGPIMDNQHWQRSYNTQRDGTPYRYGGFFFGIPLICLSLLGAISGENGNYVSIKMFSGFNLIVLVIGIMMGLMSTLSASYSAITTLYYKNSNTLKTGRIKMLLILIAAIAVVIFNFDVTALWKTYGTIRIFFAGGVLWMVFRHLKCNITHLSIKKCLKK
ncbi:MULTISPECIES: sodium:solute symporter family transporter [Clostridium]|uniref:Uncharacterized protein n=1 Tax=Clostridium lapidicellarium TaxID=3240931 RepID=A0ABV4DXI8_9CLOT